MLSSTPRKESGLSSSGNVPPPLKKPRFDLLLESSTSAGVHDMSGVEAQEGTGELVVSDDDIFRLQLQSAFQELSSQINRVGTHLAQQIEQVQTSVNRFATQQRTRKRSLNRTSDQVKEELEESSALLLPNLDSTVDSAVGGGDTSKLCSSCRLTLVYDAGYRQKKKKKPLFNCRYCLRRKFRQHASLMEHIRREHLKTNKKPDSLVVPRPYVCGICSTAFRTAALCQKHVFANHGKNKN